MVEEIKNISLRQMGLALVISHSTSHATFKNQRPNLNFIQEIFI